MRDGTAMDEEAILEDATLVFPIQKSSVLLGRKTQKIGAGLWNGYGGGIEERDPRMAAVRELREESSLIASVDDLEKVALAQFHNRTASGAVFTCTVHVFLLRAWYGEPQATQEMTTPTWFPIDQLPLDQMMLADRVWVPRALTGEIILVDAWYGPKQQILEKPIEIVSVSKEVLF